MGDDIEKHMCGCGSMTAIRKLAEKLDTPYTPESRQRESASRVSEQIVGHDQHLTESRQMDNLHVTNREQLELPDIEQ